MAQSAIKKRFNKYYARTFLNLTENYKHVHTEPEGSLFHFMAVDKLGIKYIRIELNSLSDETKRELEAYQEKCPPNTICEVRIFHKYGRSPERITI